MEELSVKLLKAASRRAQSGRKCVTDKEESFPRMEHIEELSVKLLKAASRRAQGGRKRVADKEDFIGDASHRVINPFLRSQILWAKFFGELRLACGEPFRFGHR